MYVTHCLRDEPKKTDWHMYGIRKALAHEMVLSEIKEAARS